MSTAPIDARGEEGAGELAADRPSLGNVLRHPALPEEVAMARPTGIGRGTTTYDAPLYEVPIEGRDEWVAAANRRLA